MFRHQGKRRTHLHNVRIATLLSLVAGIVNVTGFLAIQKLTTNVTGHFAYFVNDVLLLKVEDGIMYLLYILAFLFGAFTSGSIIEGLGQRRYLNIYVLPTLIEIMIFISIPIGVSLELITSDVFIACVLLYAMGLQNAFVTRISNAIVRTTHLTGLFTDLGIELSQLIYVKANTKRQSLITNIKLRFNIIGSFFIGGIIGGIAYTYIALYALFIAALLLIAGLSYNYIKLRARQLQRKFLKRHRSFKLE